MKEQLCKKADLFQHTRSVQDIITDNFYVIAYDVCKLRVKSLKIELGL